MDFRPALFNNKVENLIQGWYIPENICDQIIDEQNSIKKLLYDHSQTNSFRNYTSLNLKKLNESIFKEYLDCLDKVTNLYIDRYPALLQKSLGSDIKIKLSERDGHPFVALQRYEKNCYYSAEHYEHSPNIHPNRVLVFMTYLNTITEGGGTEFKYQNFTCNAEKGLTLIWPAYFTHVHKGVVATNSVKYILTGWYEFNTT